MTDPKYMRPGLDFAVGKAIEEAGEFLAAMGKTLRWGWQSYNPELPPAERETNAAWVRREMVDLREALNNLEREMRILDQPGASKSPSDFGGIGGAVNAEREIIANKAREWAAHYQQGSDGRNTFILMAEWIESRITPAA